MGSNGDSEKVFFRRFFELVVVFLFAALFGCGGGSNSSEKSDVYSGTLTTQAAQCGTTATIGQPVQFTFLVAQQGDNVSLTDSSGRIYDGNSTSPSSFEVLWQDPTNTMTSGHSIDVSFSSITNTGALVTVIDSLNFDGVHGCDNIYTGTLQSSDGTPSSN